MIAFLSEWAGEKKRNLDSNYFYFTHIHTHSEQNAYNSFLELENFKKHLVYQYIR